MSARKRSPSAADRDAKIIEIKALRDSIADTEAAGEACKGLYKCYKSDTGKGENVKCLAEIKAKLEKLKAKESKEGKSGGGKKKSARSRSKSPRSRSKSPRKK